MNFRTTLVLIVLAGVALGYYLIDRHRTGEEKAAEEARLTLFDVEQDALRDIVIETKEGNRFAFEMRSGDWYLSEPIDTRADQGAVSSIVRSLAGSKIERVIEEEAENLAPFGLDPEAASLSFHVVDSDREEILHLGDPSPSGTQTYARRADEHTVLLLPSALRTAVLKDLEAFRDKSVLWAEPSQITGITIRDGGTKIVAVKNDDGTWTLPGEPEYKADKAKIDGIINRLRAMRAQDFIDDVGGEGHGLAEMGLRDPGRSVTLLLGDPGAEIRLEFGASAEGPGDKVYLRRAGAETALVVSGNILDIFKETRSTLRHKRLIDLERNLVSRIDLAFRDGTRIALEKVEGEWRVVDPVSGPADASRINSMLWDFTTLDFLSIAAEPFSDLESHGLADPNLRADFFTGEGLNLATVILGDSLEGTGEFFAYSPSNDYLALVSKAILDDVPRKPEDVLVE